MDSQSLNLVFEGNRKKKEKIECVCALSYAVACDVALAAIRVDYHRGNTSNCQLFSKNIKTSITNSKRKKKNSKNWS